MINFYTSLEADEPGRRGDGRASSIRMPGATGLDDCKGAAQNQSRSMGVYLDSLDRRWEGGI